MSISVLAEYSVFEASFSVVPCLRVSRISRPLSSSLAGYTTSHHNQSTLRRAMGHPKQQQPQQQRPYQSFHTTEHQLTSESDPPPPPAPSGGIGSNSSTPRGSLEHLPPPPPHLLQSDDEVDAVAKMRKVIVELIQIRGTQIAELLYFPSFPLFLPVPGYRQARKVLQN